MPQRTNYVYRSLHDAFQGPRPSLVNVYAIVTEWTMPKPTKGSDYHVILKVIDPSVSALTTEQNNSYTDISINFFASRELLPAPRKVGDIIRLHRLSVNNYQGRTQFVAKIGMLGGGRGAGGFSRCHYCLFDGEAHPFSFIFSRRSHTHTKKKEKRFFHRRAPARPPVHITHTTTEPTTPTRPTTSCRVVSCMHMCVLYVWTETNEETLSVRSLRGHHERPVLHVVGDAQLRTERGRAPHLQPPRALDGDRQRETPFPILTRHVYITRVQPLTLVCFVVFF